MSGETGFANSTITAQLQGGRAMTRRHIETFARYFRTAPALFLPGNGRAQPPLRPTAGKPRTGGRAIYVQDGGRTATIEKSEPGTSGRKSRSPKVRATVWWSNPDRTAKRPRPNCWRVSAAYQTGGAAEVNPVAALRHE
jgi:hypothetical protein